MTVESLGGQEQKTTLSQNLEYLYGLIEANKFEPLMFDIPDNRRMFIVTDAWLDANRTSPQDERYLGGLRDFHILITPNTTPLNKKLIDATRQEIYEFGHTEANNYVYSERGRMILESLTGATVNIISIDHVYFATKQDRENYVAGIVKTVREARKAQGLE